MQRETMILPKTIGGETGDSRTTLEKLGFTVASDEIPNCYEVLAPDGWTIEWRGRDGGVFDELHKVVFQLWKKTDFWDPVFTMKLSTWGKQVIEHMPQ